MGDEQPPQADGEWMRLMVDSIVEFAVFSLDLERRIVTWNPGAERVFQRAAADALGQDARVIFTPEDLAAGADDREIETAAREGVAIDDRWHLRADGTRFWASGKLMAMRGADALVSGYVKVVQDRTAERQTEEALRASEERFARLLLGNPAGVALERADNGQLIMANEAFLDLIGYWRAEALGRTPEDLRIWTEPAVRQAFLDECREPGQAAGRLVTLRRKDGRQVRCVVTMKEIEQDGERCLLGTYTPAGELLDAPTG